jgi:hypothetical protein
LQEKSTISGEKFGRKTRHLRILHDFSPEKWYECGKMHELGNGQNANPPITGIDRAFQTDCHDHDTGQHRRLA